MSAYLVLSVLMLPVTSIQNASMHCVGVIFQPTIPVGTFPFTKQTQGDGKKKEKKEKRQILILEPITLRTSREYRGVLKYLS
jgi:hypothetical protein